MARACPKHIEKSFYRKMVMRLFVKNCEAEKMPWPEKMRASGAMRAALPALI